VGQCCLLGLCGDSGPHKRFKKRSSNASVTLQKRSTSGLHLLLDVFIHYGGFHGQWARCCGALLARVRVCLAAPSTRVRPLTPNFAPKLSTPCLFKHSSTAFSNFMPRQVGVKLRSTHTTAVVFFSSFFLVAVDALYGVSTAPEMTKSDARPRPRQTAPPQRTYVYCHRLS
jgi:hypothetical protein